MQQSPSHQEQVHQRCGDLQASHGAVASTACSVRERFSSDHGSITCISARSRARRVVLAYRSNPVGLRLHHPARMVVVDVSDSSGKSEFPWRPQVPRNENVGADRARLRGSCIQGHRQLIESSSIHPIVSAGLRAVEMQSNTLACQIISSAGGNYLRLTRYVCHKLPWHRVFMDAGLVIKSFERVTREYIHAKPITGEINSV
jgi:hypothetical protein